MSEFNDKAVIVTGGAKGIGRAICLAFAAAGADVACADVDRAAGAALEIDGAGMAGQIAFFPVDVTDADACRGLVEATRQRWGRIDVLCNNVGIQPTDSYLRAHEMPESMWDRILDVNLKSAFLMCKYTLPHMMAQGGGVIINTASVQGLQSAHRVPAYAASKGGILSLTRNLALDYARDNIRVLAINPGTIDTPLVSEAAAALIGDDEAALAQMRAAWAEAHPMGRIGRPSEIADVVLFLAGDRASFMTGSYINIDGGMMAKGAWA